MEDFIVIKEYDEQWAFEFEKIKCFLENKIHGYLDIIHVGSTSVVGLAAKPIIDLDIVIDSINGLYGVIQELRMIGYDFLGDLGVVGRFAFSYETTTFMKHHLYVVIKDSKGYFDHINIKKFLTENEGYRKKYAGVKRGLAAEFYEDREAYQKGKREIINEMLNIRQEESHIARPDFTNCSVNLTSRIMQKYGMFSKYKPIEGLDDLENYRHIILLVLCGVGSENLRHHLDENSFLRKHMISTYQSVFPPTTVSSNTALLTGMAPGESGWIGWSQFFEEVDDDVEMFSSVGAYTRNEYPGFTEKTVPFDRFYKNFMGYNSEKYSLLMADGAKTLKQLCKNLVEETKKDFITFTYGLWDQPDKIMHNEGTKSEKVHEYFKKMDGELEKFCGDLTKDTCVIITSGHGMIETKPINLNKFPFIGDCLIRQYSLEGRCASFFVKEGKEDYFETVFKQFFGSYFILYKKEEFAEKLLINYKKKNLRFLGNYIAVAINNYFFSYYDIGFSGHHAGLTKEEMDIPLIYYKGEK